MLKECSEAPKEETRNIGEEYKFSFTEKYVQGMVKEFKKESYNQEEIQELFDICNLLLQENQTLKTENSSLTKLLNETQSELNKEYREKAAERKKREQERIEHDWLVDKIY